MGKDYEAHLQSGQWRDIRKQAAMRSGGLCELCGRAASDTHHVRYPKNFSTDSAGNVLHVCRACHRKLHGAVTVIQEGDMRQEIIDTFDGRKMTVYRDEGARYWSPLSNWFRGARVPSDLQTRIASLIDTNCAAIEREDGQTYSFIHADGERWYRWPAFRVGLRKWQRLVADKVAGGSASKSEAFLSSNIDKLDRWGALVEEQAISQRLDRQAGNELAPRGGSTWEVALTRVCEVMGISFQKHELAIAGLGETVQAHSLRIGHIEAVTLKNPDEFVDIKTRFAEVGMATDITVPGTRLTEPQWVGQYLTKTMNAETGTPRTARLEGCSHMRPVNTYRRRDIDAAIAAIPKEARSHKAAA